MKILFTGGRAPATLELVRNFGQNGWEVHVADSITPAISAFSRYANYHLVNPPRHEEALFVRDLIEIINANKIDILFPTCEEIFWIARNKKILNENCNASVICDDMEKLSLLHNKYRFIEFAKEEGIPSPHTVIYDGRNNFSKKSVIKPVFSRFGEDVIIVEPQGKLPQGDYKQRPFVLQEFIEGEGVCSYGFADNGILKFNVCYKSPFKTRNAFTAFKPFECRSINETVGKIVKKLNFTGNISFDFIAGGGQYYVIECNPRITSGVHIIYENDFTKLFFDKSDALSKRKTQLLIPTLITNYRLVLFKDAIFRLHDVKPFIRQFSCLAKFGSIARKHKISLTKATVFDIEWNGESPSPHGHG